MIRNIYVGILLLLSIIPQSSYASKIKSPKHNSAKNHDHSKNEQSIGKSFSSPFIEVAKNCTPAVVFIRAEGSPETESQEMFNDDFFYRFFGGPSKGKQRPPQISQGSGFIVSSDGYIMTNIHVVRGAKKITVYLQDGQNRQVEATLVGGDRHTDIAVIKIEESYGKNFPHIQLANSDDVEVGEWVVAIGNPFQLEASVSTGIISAKGRQNLQITDYEDFIQTDAAINPGNSGGPLINLNKKVIGMNTAIVSQSGGNMGIGFAIPSNILINIQNQIVENGTVTRGFLGVSLQPIDQDLAKAFGLNSTQGALVVDIVKDSPAEKAGLKQGDIIIELNGNHVKGPSGLRNDIVLLPPETKVNLTVNRNGKKIRLGVTLGTFGQNTFVSSITSTKKLGFTVDNLTNENIRKYKLDPEDHGVVITEVETDSPASQAQLQPGYLVLAVNHKKVTNVKEFENALTSVSKGDHILLLVRQGQIMRFHSLKSQQ